MQISAFVDGELPDNEADLLLRRMGQDAELRHKVAEYIVIGRALRGEMFVPGVGRIHERVSAAIDDKPFEFEAEIETSVTPPARSIRPLAGAAVAAAVALAAIFALQQTMSVDGTDPATAEGVVAETETGYTVPQQLDDQLRQYYVSHGLTATENGANGINSRFVSLRLSEEALVESANEAETAPAEDADEMSTQP
ncbi:MAG: sigma-E factor negative regulatory protein [Gammaproteobacteria bacterium]|nr:sigma-E factor negative regulatory protein [Gammaproteobacteria bacterium]